MQPTIFFIVCCIQTLAPELPVCITESTEHNSHSNTCASPSIQVVLSPLVPFLLAPLVSQAAPNYDENDVLFMPNKYDDNWSPQS